MNKFCKTFLLSLIFVSLIAVFAYSSSLTKISDINIGTAGLGIVINDNKLYLLKSSPNGMYVFDLSDTGVPLGGSYGAVNVPAFNLGYNAMGLNPVLKKLYVGSYGGEYNFFVYDLSDTGYPLSVVYSCSNVGTGSGYTNTNSMVVNPEIKKIYTTGEWKYRIVVNDLDDSGIPLSQTGTSYGPGNIGTANYSLAMDFVRNILYIAGYSVGAYTFLIDSTTKNPLSGTGFPGSGYAHSGLCLDAGKNRLYASLRHENPDTYTFIHIYPLNSATGQPTSFSNPNLFTVASDGMSCIVLDSPRKKLYWGRDSIFEIILNSDGDPVSSDTAPTLSTVSYMAIDSSKNKLYAVNGTYLTTFQINDTATKPITINSAATYTESPNVTINLQSANAHWIYLSGDIDSCSAPYEVNKWVCVDGDRWKNQGESQKANVLSVPAVLKGNIGTKTVNVWFLESSGSASVSNNYSGVAIKGFATIQYVESQASISNITLTPVTYNGINVNYLLKDGRSRNCNVTVEFSKDSGSNWTPATTFSGSLTGLSSSFNGVSHSLVWDSEKDLGNATSGIQLRIKANNGDSEGSWFSTPTLSAPSWEPNLLTINSSRIQQNRQWIYSASLWWNQSSDSGVIYEVQKKEYNPTTGQASNWEYVLSTDKNNYEFQNLSDVLTYYFRVRARSAYGISTDFCESQSIILSNILSNNSIMDENGGSLEIEDFDGNKEDNPKVVFEKGALTKKYSVFFFKYEDGIYEVKFYDDKNKEVSYLDVKKPVYISIPYNEDTIRRQNLDENKLSIYYYDNVNWNQIASTVDVSKNTVSCKVSHFTKFRIMEANAFSSINVSPAFFTPNNDNINDRVRFDLTSMNLIDADNKITITGLDGKTIKVIQILDGASVEWDGRDSAGNICESGTYLFILKTKIKTFTGTVIIAK